MASLRAERLAVALVILLFIAGSLEPLASSPPAELGRIAVYAPETRIASVDFSPRHNLYAVALEDGEIEILATNMSPLAHYKVPNPYFIQVKFLEKLGLLSVTWSHGGYTLTLINMTSFSRRDIKLIGDTGPLLTALRLNKSLALFLFEKALLAVDTVKGVVVRMGDTPFTIPNRGVTLFRVNGSRIVLLAITTRCSICLRNNDKDLVVFSPLLRVINRITLHHVLYAYPVLNGSEILLVRDSGEGDYWSASPLPQRLGKTPLYMFKPGEDTPLFSQAAAAVYRITGNAVTVRIFYPDTLKWVKASTRVPEAKIVAKPTLRFSRDGVAAILLKGVVSSHLVALDYIRGLSGSVELPSSASLVGVRGRIIIVGTPYEALFYGFKPPSTLYNVTIHVVGENGSPLEEVDVSVNNTKIPCLHGICTAKLEPGHYTVLIGAPGFHVEAFAINVSSNLALKVKLHRVLYSLEILVRAENGTALPARLEVYSSNGKTVYKGPAPSHLLVPGGIYRVVARYFGAVNSTLVNINSNTRLTLSLALRRLLTIIPPENMTTRIVVRGAGGVVYNSTVRGPVKLSLPGGLYVVEGIAEGYRAVRVEVALTRDTVVKLRMEPLEENELTAIIYGLSGCPHCREVNTTLRSVVPRVEFREITDRRYAAQYEKLYRILQAGRKELVPLTLIFQGDRLVLAAVGGGDAEWWKDALSQTVEGKVLVIDDEGHRKLIEVNQSLIREIVFGKASSVKKPRGVALLPLVVSLAAADSVNPCTFLVFTALLIMTMRISGRRNMLLAAAAFIAAVYTAYMLLGLGLLKVFSSLPWLKYLLAALAFAFGAQSLYSVRGGEFHSPVPEKWKKLIEDYLSRIARSGSPILAFTLGTVISLTLLPCSSGPYLVAMYALASLPFTAALLYLALYNAIFVAPLVAITASVGLASHKVRALMKTRSKLPKYFEAAAGILLIAIGVYVLLYM